MRSVPPSALLALFAIASPLPAVLAHESDSEPHEAHACVYDTLIADELARGGPAPVATRVRYNIDAPAMQRAAQLQPRRKLDGSDPYPPAGYAPMRIHVDTSNLDDDRTCKANGQRVAVGNPSSSAVVCGGTRATNCYVDCTDAEVLTAAKRDYIVNEIVPRADAKLERALSVIPVAGRLTLDGLTKCGTSSFGEAEVPAAYRSSGVEADFVIFVTAHPTIGSNIAYALHCLTDERGRPIAGHFNWGPNQIDASKFELQLGVAIHEISHALGMSSSHFNRFIDPVTGAPKGATSLETAEEFTGNGAKLSVDLIVTPLVTQAVREHFGCPTLAGAQIENQGSSGTRGSHWEKRLFQNEYMTGTAAADPVLSKVTLALFEDSGWYKANFSAAEPLYWGRNLGCGFATRGCNSTNWNQPGYYCDTPQTTSCTFDYRSRGICGRVQHGAPIPAQFQLFSDPTLGGFETLADYCPYYTPLDAGLCEVAGNAIASDPRGQGFGEASRCFFSSLNAEATQTLPAPLDGACYKHACTKSEDLGVALKVELGGVWYDCPTGQRVRVAGFHGTVICPDNAAFCSLASDDKTVENFPVLDGLVPQRGPISGGTRVTIYGDGFRVDEGTYLVDIGTVACRAVTVRSSNELQCVTPKQELDFLQSSQKFDVYVTDPENRKHVITDAFTYSSAGRTAVPAAGLALAAVLAAVLMVA
jgi:leishmanolysin